MMPRITLLHGWGYDADLWRHVLPLLTDLDVEVADLGYFGARIPPMSCAAPRIAVGHSLGAMWWLALADQPWQRLVAINGFARFTATADFPDGVAPRVLERMRKQFAVKPQQVLTDFQAACGGSGPALPSDTSSLAQGLDLLVATDGRAALAGRSTDVWALAARNDAIVPAAMSAAAFAALPEYRLRWIADGDHLLPLSHPQECAQLICAAVAWR